MIIRYLGVLFTVIFIIIVIIIIIIIIIISSNNANYKSRHAFFQFFLVLRFRMHFVDVKTFHKVVGPISPHIAVFEVNFDVDVDITVTSHGHHGVSNHRSLCLVNSFCQATSKEIPKHYWLFVKGIRQWSVNTPHKGSVTRKRFCWTSCQRRN